MQKKSILARGLCLLLLLSLLSGCSQAPGPDATPNPDFGPVTAPGAAAESAGTGEEAAPAAGDEAPAEEAEGESGQEGGFSPLPEIVQLSSGVYSADTEELTAALTAEDVAQLSRFHSLKRADFRRTCSGRCTNSVSGSP